MVLSIAPSATSRLWPITTLPDAASEPPAATSIPAAITPPLPEISETFPPALASA
jgi:hypothetical protein